LQSSWLHTIIDAKGLVYGRNEAMRVVFVNAVGPM
jgi:hypothetical protein